MEIFRDIEGYEDRYQISTLGRVWSKTRHKIMSVGKHKSNSGYIQVQLYKDGKYHWKYIHRIVAKTFIPNPKGLRTVNHKDGNKENNVVTNLEWMTDEGQARHAFLTGLRHNGIALTDEQVFQVYKMYFEDLIMPKKISEIMNRPFGTIRKICYGERCKDLLRKYRDKVNQ